MIETIYVVGVELPDQRIGDQTGSKISGKQCIAVGPLGEFTWVSIFRPQPYHHSFLRYVNSSLHSPHMFVLATVFCPETTMIGVTCLLLAVLSIICDLVLSPVPAIGSKLRRKESWNGYIGARISQQFL